MYLASGLYVACWADEVGWYVNRLEWSVETLYLNVSANREAWRACKRFGWCDEYHTPPKWEAVEVKEMHSNV